MKLQKKFVDTEAAVFGAIDGLVVVLGLIAGMLVAHYGHGAVWHASLSGGLAELAGMTAGKRKSDGSSWIVSITCGFAAFIGAVLPAIPYLVAGGFYVLMLSLLITMAVAFVATWLTKERTGRALLETFALLVFAAALTVAGGFT